MGWANASNGRRLVYYSLLAPPAPRADLSWQFETSVATLRAHNPDIPVVLFLHGALPADVATTCRRFRVMVHHQGAYAERLAALCPAGAAALAAYPLLHKYLNFRELAASGVEQAMCCDLDTLFFGDVGVLFDRYGDADVVAREEVNCCRSHHGHDPSFIDEELLGRLAGAERRAPVPQFNLGFVLFNHFVVERLRELDRLFVDDAWRLVSWMAAHPVAGTALAAYGEFVGLDRALATITATDRQRALPFPSTNRWILDEVALWLALGAVPGLRTADFDRADVAQNGEVLGVEAAAAPWIACHYYTQNTHRIASWLQRWGEPAEYPSSRGEPR